MAEIKTLLDDVIETEISNLKTLPVEDERRGDAIRDLGSLHKLRIEEIKAWADVEEKSVRREMDSRQREEELAAKDADQTRGGKSGASASGAEDRPVCADGCCSRGTDIAVGVLRNLDETGIQV